MAATATLDAYKQQLSGLPEDKFIGAILWFSFHETDITRDEVLDLFRARGLDERFVPNPIKTIDAFRRATSRTVKEYDFPGDGRSATIYIEEVDYDDERVIQHIFRKVRDRKAVTLQHTRVGEAIFYRQSRAARRKGVGGESVRFTLRESELTAPGELAVVSAYLEMVHKAYERNKGFLTVQSLRGMVRDYVTSLNAISVRPSGGVYFVHKSRMDTVELLVDAVTALGSGCQLHTLPLLNTDRQREMLTEAFQDEVVEECDRLLKMLTEVNSTSKKGVPAKKYAELRQVLDDTMARADEYTRVLGLAQGRAAAGIELAMTALLEMAGRLEH